MSDLHHWLSLVHAKGIGPRTVQKLLKLFDDPEALINASTEELLSKGCSQAIVRALKKIVPQCIQPCLDWCQQNNHSIITFASDHYPQALKHIPDPPVVLYVSGNLQAFEKSALAMVGSRNATQQGLKTAQHWSNALSQHGFCIVSGLAKGIDASAHAGALSNNNGNTIAVLGSGHRYLYPRQHKKLYEHIIEAGGAVISEFPPDTRPFAGNFPRRNRIISALSHAVVVVEASMRSGSLITARLALEQGKEVFAVPGSIYNMEAQGCNHLIKQGAQLATNIDEIVEGLPLPAKTFINKGLECPTRPIAPLSMSRAEEKLYIYVSEQPCSLDQLTQKSGLTAAQVSSILVQLEIKGFIYQSGMGLYARSATTPS